MSKLTQKIATAGLAIATVATLSGPVFAQTTVDLQAQIAALLVQIQQLQAQLTAQQGGTAVTGSTYNFTRNLTVGSTGDDVQVLQQYLNAQGYAVASSGAGSPGNESSYFGSLTKSALARFQAANSVSPAVGYFGPITRSKIASLGGTTTGGTTTGGTTPVVTVPAGTDLVVSLAPDSPSSRTIGSGTAFNPALKVSLTAGATEVRVSSITLQKSGFVANTNLNGVDVIDSNGTRHGNVITSVNADSTILITMSTDPIVVSAGTTQTVTVRFNLLTGNYNGTISFGIASASAIAANTTAISGSFPISGSAMNIVNGGSSLASTTLDVLTSTGSSTLNVAAESLQEITRFRIQESSSNEGVYLHSLMLYNYGNAGAADYKDVTLEAQDGSVLATAQPSGSYVTFNLSSPYLIDKGLTRDFTVKAKLINGTTKTLNLVVYNNYDIDIRGSGTAVSVIPGAGSNDTSFPIGNGFNIQTIGSGSMTLVRASDSPSSAVAPGSQSIVLGRFLARPTGENYELRQVSFYVATSTTSGALNLTGTVYVKVNGATVYSTAASSVSNTAATTYTLFSYPTLVAGQDAVITIEGSINSSATSVSNYTVTDFDLIQAKRLVTLDLVDPGTSVVSGLQIVVNAGALTVTTLATPVANSVVAGTNNFELATIQLNAQASGEDVKVSKIVVTDTASSSVYTGISNLMMYKDSDTTPLVTTASTATNGATVTFNFQSPVIVTQNTPVTLHLKANVVSGATDTHTYNVASSTSALTAVGVSTGNTLTNGSDITFAGSGQAQTIVSSGSLTLSLVSGSGATPSTNQVMNIGTSNATVFAFTMTSQYETQKITSLTLTATSSARGYLATTTVGNIRLYQGSASTPFATAAQFDTCTTDVSSSYCTVAFTATDNLLPAAVPTTGVTIYVKADVGSGGIASLGDNFRFQITSSTRDVAVKGSVTGLTTGTRTGTPTASGYTYVVPQNVTISEVSPTAATQVGTGAGVTVAVFKVTNNGSAAVSLATSSLSFANGGSATSTENAYKIYASAVGGSQGDTSAWNTTSTTGTSAGSSTVAFDLTGISAANRKIDGGSWRYLTVKTNIPVDNSDTFQFSIAALGNALFHVDEADLGYSGNPASDNDLSDTIYALYASGLPSVATVTAKT